jgi:predicted RNA binding protein YcfA (HicA-like mRNA interferase family)
MAKKEKLRDKATNNPESLSFDDFCTLMQHQGWSLDHQRGSHQIWYSPRAFRLSVQNRNGNAKSYQVKQFLARLETEDKNNA